MLTNVVLGTADSVLNSVAAPMCYRCVGFGVKCDTKWEEREEVSKNYETGRYVIYAASFYSMNEYYEYKEDRRI